MDDGVVKSHTTGVESGALWVGCCPMFGAQQWNEGLVVSLSSDGLAQDVV